MKLVLIAKNVTLNHLPHALLVKSFILSHRLSLRFLGRFCCHTWSKSHIHALQKGIRGVGTGLDAPGGSKIDPTVIQTRCPAFPRREINCSQALCSLSFMAGFEDINIAVVFLRGNFYHYSSKTHHKQKQ